MSNKVTFYDIYTKLGKYEYEKKMEDGKLLIEMGKEESISPDALIKSKSTNNYFIINWDERTFRIINYQSAKRLAAEYRDNNEFTKNFSFCELDEKTSPSTYACYVSRIIEPYSRPIESYVFK